MPTIIRFGGGAGDGAQKLVVNVDSGATVTARKGSVAVSAVSENGQAVLELDEAGTYTVSATKDGTTTPDVKTATVPQELTLSFVAAELNTNSWEMIKAVSDAGQGANYWSVGDTKDVTLTGNWQDLIMSNVTVKAFIIGFDHNSAVEGEHRIHFLMGKIGTKMVAFCDNLYDHQTSGAYFTMNTTNTNSGGWEASRMRKTVLGNSNTPDVPLEGSLIAVLPEELRAAAEGGPAGGVKDERALRVLRRAYGEAMASVVEHALSKGGGASMHQAYLKNYGALGSEGGESKAPVCFTGGDRLEE